MKKSFLSTSFFLALAGLLIVWFCTECNNETEMKKYFGDLLQRVDKVQIQYFHSSDTLTKTLVEPGQIAIYKELINGKQENDLKCDSTGRLLYFINDNLQFEAYFSTPSTGSKYDNVCVTYFLKPDIYKTRFTYRAGMGVDEYFYEMTKAKKDTTKNIR